MSVNEILVEQRKRDLQTAKAKTKHLEKKKEEYDPLLLYTAMGGRENLMPDELPGYRAYWWRILTYALHDPVDLDLALIAVREIYYTEGIMSRWSAVPDVLHDDLGTNFEMIVQDFERDFDITTFEDGGDNTGSNT